MTTINDLAARIVAHHSRRAVPVRSSAAIAYDPDQAFGIAPIRVVSEQRVQALAFGTVGNVPQVIAIWNPLSRESGGLDAFAAALDVYVSSCLDEETLPRIWLPHRAALDMVELLGHRYRTNRNASPLLQRMGAICLGLVNESMFAGQQVVVIASELLKQHVATGQSPVEDSHLGALLAWVNPPSGVDPRFEAERRALIPAAAMLDRPVDDEVERLRSVAKLGGRRGAAAQRRIEELLVGAATDEWTLLNEARDAFWHLGLTPVPDVGSLLSESYERIKYALPRDISRPANPDTLARLLGEREYALDLEEDVLFRGDTNAREQARSDGRVIRSEVVAIDQPSPSRHPCTLTLRVVQPVMRVRVGTGLKTINNKLEGKVLSIREDPVGSGKLLEVRLNKGVQGSVCPGIGAHVDLLDTVTVDLRFRRREVLDVMKAQHVPLVYGDALPAPSSRSIASPDLLAVSVNLRR